MRSLTARSTAVLRGQGGAFILSLADQHLRRGDMGFDAEPEAEADAEPGPTTAEVVEGAWRAIGVAWDTIGSLVQGSWRKPEAAASRIHNESTIPGQGIHDPKSWQSHALSSILIGLSTVNRPPSDDEATKPAPTEEARSRSDTGPACSFCG